MVLEKEGKRVKDRRRNNRGSARIKVLRLHSAKNGRIDKHIRERVRKAMIVMVSTLNTGEAI